MTGRAPSSSPSSARFLSALVGTYQAVRAGRPSPCRFWPTCSDYALEAIEVHGALRGAWLTARRIGRCRPRGGHGVDPVPAPGGAPIAVSVEAGP